MTDLAEEVLKDIGPCISGQLIDELVKRHGLSQAAARQRLSRNKKIKRLAYLPFPKNARFLYFQQDYGAPQFWHALTTALLENTNAHGGALAALLARNGVIPVAHFSIACGSPLAQKGHLSPSAVLERLQHAKLVQPIQIHGIGPCIRLSEQIEPDATQIARLRARLKTEEILLLAIKDWARKLGLVSYDSVKLRTSESDENQPKVGTFQWDLSGPSYLAPMVSWSNNSLSPGFLVCDVLLNRQVSARDLKPFLNKCQTLRSLKRVNRCMQIFIAEDYHPDARRLAKESGIVPATPASLFGEEVANSLRQLTAVLEDTFNDASNPQRIDEIFARLNRIEGAATNLRGSLFEYIVAEIVRRNSPGNVIMNRIFDDGRGCSAEVDVIAIHHHHSTRFIECKGYKPGGTIPDQTIRKWLDKIQLIRGEALLERFWRGHKLGFEFWTTGNLSQAGRAMIVQAQDVNPDKYTITVFDSDAVRSMAAQCNDSHLMHTVNEHFFEHPLATVERDMNRRTRKQKIDG